jgi:lysozyme family protein
MSASSFPRALAFTLKYEGGKSDDSRDPGGRTNQGVTQATYNTYRKNKGLVQSDVYAMLSQERDEIYKHGYWDKVTGDSLPSGVDLCVFDYAVNSGPERALRAYALIGRGKKPAEAIHAVCSSRLSFLHALRTWSFFGTGWSKRVAACEAKSIELSGSSLGDAHSRVANTGQSFASLFTMFITASVIIVGKGIHTLPWWGICIIFIIGTLLVVNFFHRASTTKIRLGTLLEAQDRVVKDKAESLKIAIANMEEASNKLK